MGTIKGQNLRVMVGGKCIAMAVSCTFHISAAVESSSCKDDVDDFERNEVTGLSWDASTDSLVTLTDNGINGELPTDLMSLIINKTVVTLTFDLTAGTNNRTGQNSAIKKSGQAYVTDYSLTAPNRANSTLTVQFSGTGPLS